MITALQIFFTLVLIIIIILFVFKPKRAVVIAWPLNFRDLLFDYVPFYSRLDEAGKLLFEEKFQNFLSAIKITGANAEVEDLDRVLIGAAAVIPVFHIPDWEYINLKEVLVYPGNFNTEFEQQGDERLVSGMVGTGHLQNLMILSKWEIRQGFINNQSKRNTAIHEFVHLVDKMDGTLDGMPLILLEKKFLDHWKYLVEKYMEDIRSGSSDIDSYGATSPVEFFAVASEYFFEQPEEFQLHHPELNELMQRIYIRNSVARQSH